MIECPLADSPGFLVRLAQLRAFDEFHRRFAGLHFTPARFAVFAMIVANPGIRPGMLAEELRVKPPNIATLVNSLVASQLIERRQSPDELRAIELTPTPLGLASYHQIFQAHEETDTLLVEQLSPAERRKLVALLQKLLSRPLPASTDGQRSASE